MYNGSERTIKQKQPDQVKLNKENQGKRSSAPQVRNNLAVTFETRDLKQTLMKTVKADRHITK